MVEGSFLNRDSSTAAATQAYKLVFQSTASLGWEDTKVLKAAVKGDLLKVKEVLTDALARPQEACLQAGMSGLLTL